MATLSSPSLFPSYMMHSLFSVFRFSSAFKETITPCSETHFDTLTWSCSPPELAVVVSISIGTMSLLTAFPLFFVFSLPTATFYGQATSWDASCHLPRRRLVAEAPTRSFLQLYFSFRLAKTMNSVSHFFSVFHSSYAFKKLEPFYPGTHFHALIRSCSPTEFVVIISLYWDHVVAGRVPTIMVFFIINLHHLWMKPPPSMDDSCCATRPTTFLTAV